MSGERSKCRLTGRGAAQRAPNRRRTRAAKRFCSGVSAPMTATVCAPESRASRASCRASLSTPSVSANMLGGSATPSSTWLSASTSGDSMPMMAMAFTSSRTSGPTMTRAPAARACANAASTSLSPCEITSGCRARRGGGSQKAVPDRGRRAAVGRRGERQHERDGGRRARGRRCRRSPRHRSLSAPFARRTMPRGRKRRGRARRHAPQALRVCDATALATGGHAAIPDLTCRRWGPAIARTRWRRTMLRHAFALREDHYMWSRLRSVTSAM